jgi:hypothetical protein
VAHYHFTARIVKRSEGRSATQVAPYKFGQRILCDRTGLVRHYPGMDRVIWTGTYAPTGAPTWVFVRAALWNAVERRETRVNAQVAREYELSLPHELDLDAHVAMVGRFAGLLVERFGVVADCTIHRPPAGGDPRNLIAVVLIPTRRLEGGALTAKLREMSPRTVLVELRVAWARITNEALAAAGCAARVDHRSLVEQRLEALVEGDMDRAQDLDREPRPRRPQREVRHDRLARRRAAGPEAGQ